MPLSPERQFEVVPWGYGWGVRLASEFGVPFRFVDTLDEARTAALTACRRAGQDRVRVLDRQGNAIDEYAVEG